jgi:hypothetical protein
MGAYIKDNVRATHGTPVLRERRCNSGVLKVQCTLLIADMANRAMCAASATIGSRENLIMALRDNDGQPTNRAYNESRRLARTISELLGLAKGIVMDGVVTQEEAEGLAEWVLRNREFVTVWPLDILIERFDRIFADGKVDEEERNELKELLEALVGAGATDRLDVHGTTQLPLTQPPPLIQFPGKVFVLTGKFTYGSRRKCEEQIRIRGGVCESSVTLRTHYLVVGLLASRDWIQTSYGRKIEKAVEIIRGQGDLAIISEQHWIKSLAEAKRQPSPQDVLEFRVVGEGAGEYVIRFMTDGTNLTSKCSCPEGSARKFCRHMFDLMVGNTDDIISRNYRDAVRVQDWLVQSDVWPYLDAALVAKREWGMKSSQYQQALERLQHSALD